MNQKKINVLKIALDKLNNGFKYDWSITMQCNCGVVIQSAGLNTKDFDLPYGCFKSAIENCKNTCHVTGLPFGNIQHILLENGFTKQDILDLEWLANKDICKKIGVDRDIEAGFAKNGQSAYDKKEYLILYLAEWISQLEAEPPKTERIYIPVLIDKEVSIKSKELITNN